MLKQGNKAPDFTLPADDGQDFTLSNNRGMNIVLYFYPKDNTSGWIKEAEGFGSKLASFKKKNAVVVGISRDSIKSHQKFREKQGIKFALLSDEDENVCKLYDVLKEKNMYGKKVIGIERSTFVIDAKGTIIKIFRKVQVDGHAEEVLEVLWGKAVMRDRSMKCGRH